MKCEDEYLLSQSKTKIYHFEFSGLVDSTSTDLADHLQVNGINFSLAYTYQQPGGHNRLSLTASLVITIESKRQCKLVQFCGTVRGGILYDADDHFTHFTRWLVEEDF